MPDVSPHSTAGNDSCVTMSYFQIRKLASGPAVMWQPHLLQVAMVSNEQIKKLQAGAGARTISQAGLDITNNVS